MKPTAQRLAIFAGAGELPRIAANEAAQRSLDFCVYHIVEADLDAVLSADKRVRLRQISLGKIADTFRFLKEDGITDIVLLGKIEKQRLIQDVARDSASEELYARAADRRDDTLFLEFARAITAMGISIWPQRELLSGLFLQPGTWTKLKPESEALLADINFGFELSRRVGSLDIGQTAIVYEKMILAVEAIEGTDAAIRRAGEIARGKGGVVCKTAKASQDPRFDLPAVGIRTLETMAAAGMQALVIQAGQTIVVNPAEFIARADALGLVFVAKEI